MKRLTLIFPLAIVLCLLSTPWTSVSKESNAKPPPQNAFVPDCPPPFPDASPRPVDVSCGNEGAATAEAHKAQNRAKNSFCAKGSNGSVATIPITHNGYNLRHPATEGG